MKKQLKKLYTIRDFVRWGASRFQQQEIFYGHGTDNAFDEALALVLSAIHLDDGIDKDYMGSRLTKDEKEQIAGYFQQRIDGRLPVPYITGKAWFAGLPFIVDQSVLIPRSPIAELISKQFDPWVDPDNVGRILDLCTGSACIAIACAMAFPDALVDASDISADALKVAEKNRQMHDVCDQLSLYQSDVFDSLPAARYDIIVSNPPYVNQQDMDNLPKEYLHEPALGLAAGNDGLDIVVRILNAASRYLTSSGILIVEVGRSAPALIELYPQVPFFWLDFEFGGDGVFLLTAEDVREFFGSEPETTDS